MKPLLQFNEVTASQISALSFTVRAGEMRVLKVPTEEARVVVIELTLGEMQAAKGEILLRGQTLDASKPGTIGWVPARGGLISNLITWQNITLPLWYHGRRQTQAVEEKLSRWLSELQVDPQEWENFMACPAGKLKLWERKMAGLLRGLLQAPQLLLIEAGLFDEIEAARSQLWINALEKYVRESDGSAVLAVTNTATVLPWEIIERS